MFSLPKAQILRGHKAFSGIMTRGKSITSGSLRLFYAPSTRSLPLRAGFSVSRAIRKATVRNRIKRCLREAFRLHAAMVSDNVNRGVEIVFLYRGENTGKAAQVECRTIEKDMIKLLDLLRKKTA